MCDCVLWVCPVYVTVNVRDCVTVGLAVILCVCVCECEREIMCVGGDPAIRVFPVCVYLCSSSVCVCPCVCVRQGVPRVLSPYDCVCVCVSLSAAAEAAARKGPGITRGFFDSFGVSAR